MSALERVLAAIDAATELLEATLAGLEAALDALPADDRAPWAALLLHLLEGNPRNVFHVEGVLAPGADEGPLRVTVAPVLAAFAAALRAYEIVGGGGHDPSSVAGGEPATVAGAAAGGESTGGRASATKVRAFMAANPPAATAPAPDSDEVAA